MLAWGVFMLRVASFMVYCNGIDFTSNLTFIMFLEKELLLSSSVCFQNKVQWCDFDEIFQSLQNIIIVAKIKSIEGVRRLVKLKKFAFIQPLSKGSYKKSWTDKKCQLKRLLPLINWHLFCASFKLFVSIVWMCKLSLVSLYVAPLCHKSQNGFWYTRAKLTFWSWQD